MRAFRNIVSFLLMMPVYFYQWFISPLKGPSCRHVPTCSSYAIEALRRHGPWHGLVLGTGRILRCRPGGTHGYDPVPLHIFRKYRAGRWHNAGFERCNRLKGHQSE